MFKRKKDALTRAQRRTLSGYARAVDGGPEALLKLDDVAEGKRADLAMALDQYGTPAEKQLFIDGEASILLNGTGLALMRLGFVREALTQEARAGWPQVRDFPFFAGMRAKLEESGHSREAFERGDVLIPDSPVMLIAWYSAFGGDEPRSLMDLKNSGACLDSFRWLLLARKKLESRVEREMRERR
jgi:hypothetical protein